MVIPRGCRVHMRSDSIGPPGSQKTLINQIVSHGQRVSDVQVCPVCENSRQGQQARPNDPPKLTHQEDYAGTNL